MRHTLWVLKQALGHNLLRLEGEQVGLNTDLKMEVDFQVFQKQLTLWRCHGHDADKLCADCLVALTTAAALYRDDFLAGFTLRDSANFDEWQRTYTEQLRRELADVLHKLADYHGAQQEWETAIAYARRWLSLDPLHEPAHRRLMELYARSGQWRAAVRQYDECVLVLAQDLQAAPAAETTDLLATLKREQQPAASQSFPSPTKPRPADEAAMTPATHNLPAPVTSLLGRNQATAAIQKLFRAARARLITLTGPGGVGKTRLALHVAQTLVADFAGVYLIALAPLYEPDLLLAAIAQTLGIQEVGDQPLLQTVKDALRNRQILLVLDNFEHIISAAPMVADLLAAAPQLKVLVTSRERLRLYGEQVYTVPPLPLPESQREPTAGEALQAESVQLFVQRAQAVNPDFSLTDQDAPVVTAICRRLDGLPLAIELAAARSDQLSPQTILQRLTAADSRQAALLRSDLRDIAERHRTLNNTLQWSYHLLTADEQKLLRWLAIFVGGCSLEAVIALCGGMTLAVREQASSQPQSPRQDVLGGLTALVNKNLLQRTLQPNGEPRFSLLETIRQFGMEWLQSTQELAQAQSAHCRYYTEFAVAATANLYAANKTAWLELLAVEHDNLRAALKFVLDQQATELGLRLGSVLWRFWNMRGDIGEGRRWLTALLNLPMATQYPAEVALSLFGLGVLAGQQSAYELAHAALEKALEIASTINDHLLMAEVHTHLGMGLRSQGEYAQAQRHHEQGLALARAVGDKATITLALQSLAKVLDFQGKATQAMALLEEALALANEIDDSDAIFPIAFYLGAMARQTWRSGNRPPFLNRMFGACAIDRPSTPSRLCLERTGDNLLRLRRLPCGKITHLPGVASVYRHQPLLGHRHVPGVSSVASGSDTKARTRPPTGRRCCTPASTHPHFTCPAYLSKP